MEFWGNRTASEGCCTILYSFLCEASTKVCLDPQRLRKSSFTLPPWKNYVKNIPVNEKLNQNLPIQDQETRENFTPSEANNYTAGARYLRSSVFPEALNGQPCRD